MYHRVAEDGPAALREWRVEPRHFEEQLAFLKREGFTTITSRELGAAMRGERALPRRPVMLTFDDAYVDFYTDAFPLLKKHGATAELFVVSGKVGGAADWDSAYGPPAPLMGWTQLAELDRAGIVIGSHLVSHAKATSLDDETLIREGAVSRFMLEARLGHPVTSLALPFGDHDDRVIDAMMLCGYREVYTCEPVVAALSGDPLRIPRLNIGGDIDLPSFARMLDVASAKRAALA
jgi:peptidoglycan/xylan/chitin deacetylase (PgdA/CDA1 family)